MRKYHFVVDAVIFDMDGVITNTMPDHYLSWKVVLKKEGIDVTYHDIYLREGQRGINSVREIFKNYGKTVTIDRAEKILARKESLFKKITKKRFVVGIRRFLKAMHKKGFRLALVTGTAKHELHRILPKRLYDLFDVVVTGSDVRHGKPHPEPFNMASRMLNIKKKRGVVIVNAPFGIRSAKAAGICCLALETSLPKNYLKQADAVFESVKELQERVGFELFKG